ncbi:unnamed protein product [marine sediment metagenome]|uniref:Malectin domain-containing protein n=1 Tax=marine sediment metagenome TaxID=412755 RepID=X1CVN8_9ZZZZ
MRGTAPAMKAVDIWDVLRAAIIVPNSMGTTVGHQSVISASDNLLMSSDGEKTNQEASMTKEKEFKIFCSGVYRVKVEVKSGNGSTAQARVYKNGAAHGDFHAQADTYAEFEEDLEFDRDDLVQLYATKSASTDVFVRNFRLCGDIGTDIGVEHAV